jgi:uncharacterized repeat protein (TIGR03803 family)
MPSKKLSALTTIIAASVAALLFFGTLATAQTETVLQGFGEGHEGAYYPVDRLILDQAGNLYGTTEDGGKYNCGVVYELSPTEVGGWSEKILHDFDFNGVDGATPMAGLVMDGAGNLYGTTYVGGADDAGTVYELIKQPGGGGWQESILHSFHKTGGDGQWPEWALAIDSVGNLYGVTAAGGDRTQDCSFDNNGCGTVFELSPEGSGRWTEKILFAFPSGGSGGYNPNCQPILDSAGNLYGVTYNGGVFNQGTVWQLVPGAGGTWTENILYNFDETGTNGYYPGGALVFDSVGDLYGVTGLGGGECEREPYGCGTVFELSPAGGGVWNVSWIYRFTGFDTGATPNGELIFDPFGNLYGTARQGGSAGWGIAFELSPSGRAWTETELTSFNVMNGSLPTGGLVLDSSGNLYGVTYSGSLFGGGAAYEITP